jgi:hypothetical protein
VPIVALGGQIRTKFGRSTSVLRKSVPIVALGGQIRTDFGEMVAAGAPAAPNLGKLA